MNIEQLTNQKDLWTDLALPNDTILWAMYHQKAYDVHELTSLPTWSAAKHIFLINQEALQVTETVDFDTRIHIWDSTVSTHPRVHSYFFWWDWINEINNRLNLDSKLINFKNKNPKYLFDALFGNNAKHRNFVRNLINTLPNRDKILLGSNVPSSDRAPDTTDWVNGGSYETGSSYPGYYGNQTGHIACFLPYEIYNDSWYSIIAETRRVSDVFFSEKTGKPLLAKRLFVMFSILPNYLEHLRSLGYKTFGSVIDESYDTIQDNTLRWNSAWKQVLKLMDMDPVEVYSKIEPVLEHNYQLFTSTNWQNKMKQEIKDLLTTT